MTVITWTQRAEQDLENILAHYLNEAGLQVAQSIFVRIHAQVQSLRQFSHCSRMGRVAGTRELIIPRLPYIVIIQAEADKVFVLNVVHTARQYPV